MKVMILTQFYLPEMGAPPQRLSEWANGISQRGHEVEIVTARPNYPTGRVFDGLPTWRVIRTTIDHNTVWQLPLFTATGVGWRRLLSFVSFSVSAVIGGTTRPQRPDVILVESPPLFLTISGWLVARRFRSALVINISDLWPRSAVDMGVIAADSVPGRIGYALERWAYRRARAITAQSQGIADEIAHLAEKDKVHVVLNGVTSERFGREVCDPPDWFDPECVTVVYAGLFGFAQDVDLIVDVAEQLIGSTPSLQFVLVGQGPTFADIATRAASIDADRIRVLPAVPRDEIPSILSYADIAIVPLVGDILGAVPSKIYEAMAARLPIVLLAQGEARTRVVEAEAGIAVDPGDRNGTCEAIQRLVENRELREKLGAHGRRAAETVYARSAQIEHLEKVLTSLD